jgi:hypothetical protein
VNPHDAILVNRTDETRFLSIMHAEVLMVGHAFGKVEALTKLCPGQAAIKVHPLTAVIAPGLPAKRLTESGRDQSGLEGLEMLTGHSLPPYRTSSGD